MKIRTGAVLVIGTLVGILAGCGSAQYKDQKTGGEAQMQMIKPGQPLQPPSGAPGVGNVGAAPMSPSAGAPVRPPGN